MTKHERLFDEVIRHLEGDIDKWNHIEGIAREEAEEDKDLIKKIKKNM
jgi:hypothetical protein